MKINKQISEKKKHILITLIIFMCNVIICSADGTQSLSPFASDEERTEIFNNNGTSVFGKTNDAYNEYFPFQKDDLSKSYLKENVLRGPVGPPINGLPIDDSYLFIFLMILGYAVFRIIKRKPVE